MKGHREHFRLKSYIIIILFVNFCFIFDQLQETAVAGEWLVLPQIEISKKTERVKYAKFLKDQHYNVIYRIIPSLTPSENDWLQSRKKSISDALNEIKDKNEPLGNSEEGRAWLSMEAQFESSPLYIQSELKRSLNQVIGCLDMVIDSKDFLSEMQAWALVLHSLLDNDLNANILTNSVRIIENNNKLAFPANNFVMKDMSRFIASQIDLYIILPYIDGKLTK